MFLDCSSGNNFKKWWKDELWVVNGRWIKSRRPIGRSRSVGQQPKSPVVWRRLSAWPEALLSQRRVDYSERTRPICVLYSIAARVRARCKLEENGNLVLRSRCCCLAPSLSSFAQSRVKWIPHRCYKQRLCQERKAARIESPTQRKKQPVWLLHKNKKTSTGKL